MTGRDPPQELVHDASVAAGSPGFDGEQQLRQQQPAPSVRFQPRIGHTNYSISPAEEPGLLQGSAERQPGLAPPGVTTEQLKDLTSSLGAARLQGLRVANFSYEPMSLPASRTASHEDDSRHASGHQTPLTYGAAPLSIGAARAHDMQSPPLTPSGTPHADAEAEKKSSRAFNDVSAPRSPQHAVITPQASSTKDPSPPASRGHLSVGRPVSIGSAPRRPVSSSDLHDSVLDGNHRKGMFSLGPAASGSSSTHSPAGGKSLPASRDASPSRNNSASQFYVRPFSPAGDSNDPYAADKRQPQNKIEPRFVFPRLSSKRRDASPSAAAIAVPKKDEKRHSGLFGGHPHIPHKRDKDGYASSKEDIASQSTHSRQGSMSDLKRFFKLGPVQHHKMKRAVSPAPSYRSSRTSKPVAHMPFADESSLTSKYGKLGRVLGAGAGGSVRLMKRSEDNTVFAVKEFRARHTYENEKDYVKKLTAEYCIGSSLHHGNVIETLDIIRERARWYEVMEYAPYDLFAIVMTGRMSRAEVACCFLQILSGVTYLHSMGLAHRDLKLDNVVVSEHGIMKIIDFGSAHVFKYPFESGIVKASGEIPLVSFNLHLLTTTSIRFCLFHGS